MDVNNNYKRKKSPKIVKIIDEYNVVINIGENAGVKCGDEFQIYTPPLVVHDPDTGATLGTLTHVKAKIVVKGVTPLMAVCQNTAAAPNSLDALSRTLKPRPAQLKVDPEQISGGFDDIIRIGDIVQKVRTPSQNSQESSLPECTSNSD